MEVTTTLAALAFVVNLFVQTPVLAHNNPGNLVKSNSHWVGEVHKQGRFTAFKSSHYGLRALCIVLLRYEQRHKIRTVEQLVNRFAPKHENNHRKYVNFLCKKLGVTKRQKISISKVMPILVPAIIQYEHSRMPYNKAQIQLAILDAKHYTSKHK